MVPISTEAQRAQGRAVVGRQQGPEVALLLLLAAEVKDGRVTTFAVRPQDLGFEPARPEDLAGGDAAASAEIALAILKGEQGPRRDIVLLNAAAAIVAGGRADDLKQGMAVAAESIDSGAAAEKLERLRARTMETP